MSSLPAEAPIYDIPDGWALFTWDLHINVDYNDVTYFGATHRQYAGGDWHGTLEVYFIHTCDGIHVRSIMRHPSEWPNLRAHLLYLAGSPTQPPFEVSYG